MLSPASAEVSNTNLNCSPTLSCVPSSRTTSPVSLTLITDECVTLFPPIVLEGDEDLDHIILETGGNILMETGHRTLNEDQGFVTRGSLDRVELETGGILISEDGQFPPSAFASDFTQGAGSRIVLEDFEYLHMNLNLFVSTQLNL